MVDVTPHAEGCIIRVRAQPGARRTGVVGEQAGALKIAVTAPPDQGRANKALVEALSDLLDIKRSSLELISGPASRDKKFLVRGLDVQAVQARLRGSA